MEQTALTVLLNTHVFKKVKAHAFCGGTEPTIVVYAGMAGSVKCGSVGTKATSSCVARVPSMAQLDSSILN